MAKKPEDAYQNISPELLQKVQHIVNNSNQLTENETALLKKLLKAYEGWLFVGRIGKVIILALAAIGTLVATYQGIFHK